jgi:hypothetical protein
MSALPAPFNPAGGIERRRYARPSDESAAAGLIDAILRAPQTAAADLVRDVDAGADPQAVLALLEAATTLARLRGLKIDHFVQAMRARLTPPATEEGVRAKGGLGRLASWLRAWLSGG